MKLCSKYTDQPAIATYLWPWGETGLCSAKYQLELNQTAGNLSRTILFLPLADAQEAPMERSERTKLKAECLVLEEELSECKLRAVAMYQENVNLTAQVRSYAVNKRELEAQLSDVTIKAGRLEQSLVTAQAAQGEMVEELTQLRTIAKYVDQSTEPATPTQ